MLHCNLRTWHKWEYIDIMCSVYICLVCLFSTRLLVQSKTHLGSWGVFFGAKQYFVPQMLCSVGTGDTGHSASHQKSFHCSRCLMFKILPFYLDISQFNACLDQCQKLLKSRSQDFTLCDTSAAVQSPFSLLYVMFALYGIFSPPQDYCK